MQCRNSDFRIFNGNNFSELCRNLVSNPREYNVRNYNFCDDTAKQIEPNISECTGPIFTKFAPLVGIWVGMINLKLILQ